MKRFAWTGVVVLGALVGGCTEVTFDADWKPGTEWWGQSTRVRGSGIEDTVSFDLSAFDAVEVWGVGTVVIERTGRERVTVTGDDNVLPYLEVGVLGGVLRMGPAHGADLALRTELVYHLEVTELTWVTASGAVAFEGAIGRQPLLAVSLSGATAFAVEGQVDELRLDVSGASSFGGLALEGGLVTVSASGASHVLVWAADRLMGSASGTAVVRYAGDPLVSMSVSGLASVRPY